MSALASSSPQVKFETYEQVFLGLLISMILGIPIYLCTQYWENLSEVRVYGTVGVAVCLCVTVFFLLYKVFSYKGYVLVLIFMLFLTVLSGLTWKTFVPLNSMNTTSGTEDEKLMKEIIEPLKQEEVQPFDQHLEEPLKQWSKLPLPKLEQTQSSLSKPNEPTTDTLKFDGDCVKYSRQLLSQAVLKTPKKHQIKGQVVMFKRTIHLTGRPSFGDASKYEGDALDVMNRRHNAGAESYVSVEDAVKKALIKVCENLRREGYDTCTL